MPSLAPTSVWRHSAYSTGDWRRGACLTTLVAVGVLLPLTCGAHPRPASVPDAVSPVDHPSPQLAALLRNAEVAFLGAVRGPEPATLVLIRKPTPELPLHRCGAGTEDFLLLLRPRGGVMRLDDQLQVQSCELGEHLDVDDPESTEQLVHALRMTGGELILPTRYSFSPTPDAVVSRRYTIGKRFQPVH